MVMANHCTLAARCWSSRVLLTLLIVAACSSVAVAQTSPTVVRVEEDWELVIETPDPGSDGPQITCAISPLGNLDSLYATFELNHQSELTFEAGGLQLQIWDGEVLLSDKGYPNRNVLSQAGEVITWTQCLEVQNDTVTFEVINGISTTWGNFGGQGYLKAMLSTTLTDLGSYNSSVSVGDSGVSYGGNRVSSLVLKSVRFHLSTGEVIEDDVPKVIHWIE